MRAGDNAVTFIRNAERANAHCLEVRSEEEFCEAAHAIIAAERLVHCPGVTDYEKSIIIPGDQMTTDLSIASCAFEEVHCAIADTGTIVCVSVSGKTLQASLLPQHHVAILREETIYPNFRAFAASWNKLPSTISLITGPSRTADIEKTLVLGMHGPKKVTVIVVRNTELWCGIPRS